MYGLYIQDIFGMLVFLWKTRFLMCIKVCNAALVFTGALPGSCICRVAVTTARHCEQSKAISRYNVTLLVRHCEQSETIPEQRLTHNEQPYRMPDPNDGME
jgi:hypothetical protein